MRNMVAGGAAGGAAGLTDLHVCGLLGNFIRPTNIGLENVCH